MSTYLLVDAGNSRIKWNVYNAVNKHYRLAPQSVNWRADDIASILQDQWQGLTHIDAVLLANVAGQAVQQAVQHYAQTQWGVQTTIITTQAQTFGVRNAYKVPSQLGVDRWLVVLAANQLFREQNVCVVDCGTAITVDTVTKQHQHLGGLIVPGPQMMKTALLQQTHGVKISRDEVGLSPFTDSTTVGVNHGVLLAAIGFVDRAVADIETELDGSLTKIITGGDAQIIAAHSRHTLHHEPEMVLKGLALYASENK